ncbi:MAG: (2Fe-2S)-binding protein [Candidatus Krumholzibacteriia bacterium]
MDGADKSVVTIRYEGRPLRCRGDTSVAVALWEAGVKVLSHSPKYGRPRGLHCARGHCTSCLMRIDGIPNVRACQTPVRAGMQVRRQDPGAFYGRPLQRVMAAGGELFPVGFYYKWFTRPALVSRLFLKLLRPLTGVGRLPDPDVWSGGASPPPAEESPGAAVGALAAVAGEAGRDLGVFDTVIVGAGVTGLRAAAAARGRVLLVDDHPAPGGQRRAALAAVAEALGDRLATLPVLARAHAALEQAVRALAPRPGLELAPGSRAVCGYHPDTLVIRGDCGLSLLRARQLVWAAGALDVIGLFPGNDLPSLLGPRGLYRAVARDGLAVRGRQVLVAGGGLDLWLAAALLHARGARVTLAPGETGWAEEISAAVTLGWKVHTGLRVSAARGGGGALESVRLDAPDGGESDVTIDCELAVVCERGKPAYDIPYQLGADLVLSTARGGYILRGTEGDTAEAVLPGGLRLTVAGEATGGRPEAALESAGEVRSR